MILTDNTANAPLSRREFAKRAALGTAAAMAATPLADLAQVTPSGASPEPQAPANAPKLSPQSQAEAESRYQSILSAYADRFSDAQKTDLKRLCFVLQTQLDQLRAWPVVNSDAPALYLKPLVEREKKSKAAPNLKSAPAAAKREPSAKPTAQKLSGSGFVLANPKLKRATRT